LRRWQETLVDGFQDKVTVEAPRPQEDMWTPRCFTAAADGRCHPDRSSSGPQERGLAEIHTFGEASRQWVTDCVRYGPISLCSLTTSACAKWLRPRSKRFREPSLRVPRGSERSRAGRRASPHRRDWVGDRQDRKLRHDACAGWVGCLHRDAQSEGRQSQSGRRARAPSAHAQAANAAELGYLIP
jgi:hypothetical protein